MYRETRETDHTNAGTYTGKILVRKSDWLSAINEHKKVHLLGGAALDAYVKKTQALADALPAQIEVRVSTIARCLADLCRDQLFKLLQGWGNAYEVVRKHTMKYNNKQWV